MYVNGGESAAAQSSKPCCIMTCYRLQPLFNDGFLGRILPSSTKHHRATYFRQAAPFELALR